MNDTDVGQTESVGVQRREEMLQRLVGVMEATHRYRRARRRAVAAGGVMAAAVLVFAVRPILLREFAPARVTRSDSTRLARYLQVIKTDPTTVGRFAARRTGRAQLIDDRTLRQVLLSINRPAEVIIEGDRIRLSAPVTDKDLGI